MNDLAARIAARADEQAQRIAYIPETINGGYLPPRQREVLALLMDGLTNAEVASVLLISPETVKSQMKNMYERTHARNRMQLAAWAAMGRTRYFPAEPLRVAS